jgi:TetR/AcrR family transcriptional regulator, lmrAB and yxaGH operons repressor
MPRPNVRREMAEAASRLLASKGLEGTSVPAVLEAAGAPRGSVYHHFPAGKQELLDAALKLAQGRVKYSMAEVSQEPATAVVERFIGLWERQLRKSGLASGCAVMAAAVAAGDNIELLNHSGAVFSAWRRQLTSLLESGGIMPDEAESLASLVIAACEGAVGIARAEGDLTPFRTVTRQLLALTAEAQERGEQARELSRGQDQETDFDDEL